MGVWLSKINTARKAQSHASRNLFIKNIKAEEA